MNTNTLSIDAVNQAVRQAVSKDNESKGKWQAAGQAVAGFYMTAENLESVKAQFIADAILPGLDKKHAQALAVELPRKGSKEYNELSEANQAKWEDANQAKKDARSTCDTYFSRVVSYAFPKPKEEKSEEEQAAANSLETKFNKVLSDLIGKCEKAENASFDVVAVKAALVNAQKLVNTAVNK
jgi:hypothetical protein